MTTESDHQRHSTGWGSMYIILSSVCFCFSSLLVRLAESRQNASTSNSLFVRGVGMSFIIFSFLAQSSELRSKFQHDMRTRLWLHSAGVIGAASWYLTYVAWSMVSIGNVAAILCTSSVFSLGWAYLLIGEKVTLADVVSSVIMFVGVWFLSVPSSSGLGEQAMSKRHNRVLGSAVALMAAFSTAVWIVVARKLANKVHPFHPVLIVGIWSVAMSIPMGGVLSWSAFIGVQGSGTFVLVCSAILSFSGQSLFIFGLQMCRAGPANTIRSLDVPLAHVLSIAVLREYPSFLQACGSGLMVVAAIIAALQKA